MVQAGATLQERYKIDKQIGQGGMGAVYVGTDVRFGSTVAIKETLCMDANFRKAIEREARLLNSLKHNALPRVSDHFEEQESQFLVMEYITGKDLCCVMDDEGKPFGAEQVLTWADQLLDALDYLHTQESPVIHRDIKPQNLKITPRGQIILLDFGLAKGNPTDAGNQTAAKSIFGYSRNYASLEQIQGTGTDPRSDLYSLAATLYHLLTGVPPEDALTRAMSVLSQKADPLRPACAVNPAVPRGLSGVLQKALDLNADQRPASAAEMRQMLREHEQYGYLADNITVAGIAPEPSALGEPTRLMPHSTQAGVPGQTDIRTEVLSGGLSEVTSVAPHRVVTEGDPSSTPRPNGRRGFALAAGALALVLVGGGIAGGLYVMKPSVFGAHEAPETQLAPAAANAASEDVPRDSVDGSPTAPAAVSTDPAGETRAQTSDGKQQTAAKEKTPAAPTRDKEPIDPSSGTQPGDVRITQSEIVVRDPASNQVITVRPPPPGVEQLPGGVDLKRMTPAQRQRLLRILRNNPPPDVRRPPPANRP
jgi:eukaryotic-like serine/threonine-protein kinase